MEPAAPGTEDETVDFNSLNKQETENDRLLKLKAVLKDGRFANVFELTYVNGCEHWFCNVCECPIMGRVYQHELGRRHSQNMTLTYKRQMKDDDAPKESKEGSEELTSRLEIAPGEPVPPGFEAEMSRQAQIQERLDGFKVGPLVALEYLIEMQDYDPSKEPMYLCILCDKKGDPRTVLTHLASYNHISQYLQKHFPTCYRTLAPYMTKQYKRNWQAVLQKIAEAIEKKFGRLRPFCIDQDKFEKDRMQYLTMISKGKHFSEQNGPNFVELVVHEELTKSYDEEGRPIKTASSFGGKPFIEREPIKPVVKRSPSPPVVARPVKKSRAPGAVPPNKPFNAGRPTAKSPAAGPRGRRSSLSSVSSKSSDEGHGRGGRRMARNRSPPPRDAGRRPHDYRDNRGITRRRSPSPRRRSPSPRRRRVDDDEERRRNREKERLQKMEEYTKLSKAIQNDVEKTMKQYEKNPEKHPKYNDEWKLFWNRRYKELQAEGKDPSKHDFKPEWIEFWGKRMRELGEEELKNRKEGLRRRLGLGEEPAPISFKIGGGPPNQPKSSQPKENRPNMPMAARPDNDPEIIFLDDKDDKPEPRKPAHRDRSHSPWESDTSPPRSAPKGRRLSRSPGSDKRRGRPNMRSRDRSVEKRRSRERSLERKRSRARSLERRSLERRRSVDRIRRSPERIRRSPERIRRSPDRGRRSRSRDLPVRRSKERSLRRSPGLARDLRDRRSRSPDSYKRYSRERDREYIRERDLRDIDAKLNSFPSRERSWERGVRESSFERDMRGKDRIRTVADLPWEREKMMYPHGPHHGPPRMMPHDDYYAPPPHMRDVGRQPQLNFVPPPDDDEPDDGEVNIVSVLRLLTALEERLGSLGPKIIDLLAQALALEKKEANSSETLLDNEINCVMFETVKEKLKGQLLAGLVDPHQERAFKKAIQKTASLIHLGSQRKKQRVIPAQAAVAVPGVGAVDKAAIARQLANALVAQGKTDVTQAELEQLINAVVGMAEASKNSNRPVNTASFLAQLTGGGAAQPNTDTQKEKIIIPRVRSSEDKRDDRSRDKEPLADLSTLTEPLSPGTPERSSTSNMENLSDSDLQTLLQNFKDLSTEEQMNLINYLKKLELDEPERVERLRKFVNLGGDKSSRDIIDLDKEPSPRGSVRRSPFSSRTDEGNPDSDSFNRRKVEEKAVKIHLDSEDEDYSYEDVVKAASKNVKEKEIEDSRSVVENAIDFDTAQKGANLTDAKTLISNLMSSIASSVSSNVNLLGLPSFSTTLASSTNSTTPTSSAEFAKALSGINMDNLASIVSNVQKATQEKKLQFEPPVVANTLSPRESFRSAPPNKEPEALNISTSDSNGALQFEPPGAQKSPNAGPSDAPSLGTGQTRIGPTGPLGPRALGPRPTSLLGPGPIRGPMGLGPMGGGPMGPGPMGGGPMASGRMGGPMGPGRMSGPMSSGKGIGLGPNVPMSMGVRPGMGPTGFPQQRGPHPNQFGNHRPLLRLQFNNPGFNNPRYGGPRGPGFNNKW